MSDSLKYIWQEKELRLFRGGLCFVLLFTLDVSQKAWHTIITQKILKKKISLQLMMKINNWLQHIVIPIAIKMENNDFAVTL